MRLSKSESVFLHFITEEMDESNFVTNSFQIRDKFNALLHKIGQEAYSDSTIHRCFSNLVKHHLITKEKGRGLYQVSPVFFFKGSEEQRAKVLRKILEVISKEPINKLRHQLLSGTKASSFQVPDPD